MVDFTGLLLRLRLRLLLPTIDLLATPLPVGSFPPFARFHFCSAIAASIRSRCVFRAAAAGPALAPLPEVEARLDSPPAAAGEDDEKNTAPPTFRRVGEVGATLAPPADTGGDRDRERCDGGDELRNMVLAGADPCPEELRCRFNFCSAIAASILAR